MTILIASILMLGVGPMIYAWFRHQSALLTAFDILIVASITGLILFEIVPKTVNGAGWMVLVVVAIGALVPTALEHVLHKTDLHRVENWTHRITLAGGISGLTLHTMLDGAAIASAGASAGNSSFLSAAIVLHRLPVGLTIWWLVRPAFGKALAGGVLLVIGLATVVGFAAGSGLTDNLSGTGGSWFQAFVAGSLLHVVFFRKHLEHG